MTWQLQVITTTMHQPIDDQPARTKAPSIDTIKTRIVAALAQARKYRHHADCHCRMFKRQACNEPDQIWTRAMNRELDNFAARQGMNDE